jgi:hypothetical protein
MNPLAAKSSNLRGAQVHPAQGRVVHYAGPGFNLGRDPGGRPFTKGTRIRESDHRRAEGITPEDEFAGCEELKPAGAGWNLVFQWFHALFSSFSVSTLRQ